MCLIIRKACLLFLLILFLAGCVAPDLQDVRMNRSIFLKTPRGATVYVDVRNTGAAQDFPLEPKMRELLKAKGYKLVSDPKNADIIFRANIRYSGLARDANSGLGAGIGAQEGGLVGLAVANNTYNQNYAAGAAAGVAIGALFGYAAEEAALKSTFFSVVDIYIEEKGNPFPETASLLVTLREHDLKMQEAVDRMVNQVATQMSGIF